MRIKSLSALVKASLKRRAVICPGLRMLCLPTPAAFVVNMQGIIIHRLITAGLFIYTPKKVK